MTLSRTRTVTQLTISKVITTRWVGAIGVRSASTMKVSSAEISDSKAAMPPMIRIDRPTDGAGAARSAVAVGSTLKALVMTPQSGRR